MHRRKRRLGLPLPLLASVMWMTLVVAGVAPALAQQRPEPVTAWSKQHAIPLRTTDPGAALDDLEPLRRSIGDSQIVGLGESTHGAAEELRLKHRTMRLLVEQLGFRSIAWEDDWTTGLLIDDYIRTGRGDLDALMAQMSPQWQSREVADVLRWLREYNARHNDKVRFVGVEYYFTRAAAYDAVDAYVATAAPDRLPELRRHLNEIRPTTPNAFDWVMTYVKVENKQPFIDHAHRVHALVESLPHRAGDREHALALHNARQIVSFYEHYNLPQPPASESLVYRDTRAAENLRWWQELSGDKVVYWAASAHTANAPDLRVVVPGSPDWRWPTVGSYLHRWYGERYLSIGFTFDHGTVSLGQGETVALPEPKEGWFERPFGEVDVQQFALDLRSPAPPPVERWLEGPIQTRGFADSGPESSMSGGSLAQWFDVIVHRQEVSPARQL
jgi:erythromycin esterase-like protein